MERMQYLLKQKKLKKSREKTSYKFARTKKGTNAVLWICDFETLTINTNTFKKNLDTQIILWCARKVNIPESEQENGDYLEYKVQQYHTNTTRRQHTVYETTKFVCGTNGESFIDFVLNSPKSSTYYFHNLKYDATFIIPLLCKDKRVQQAYYSGDNDHIVCNGIDENGKLLKNYWDMFRDGKKIFNIKLHKKGANRLVNIEFRCTALMLSSSVKALGDCLAKDNQTFMNQKLTKFLEDEQNEKETFYDVEPVENIKDLPINYFNYCLRDVEIVRRSMNIFNEMINNLPTMKIAQLEKLEHNKRMLEKQNNTRHGLYKEDGKMDVWNASITISGLMRKLLQKFYIPTYQARNKQYAAHKRYKHNKKLMYGNFANLDYETYKFFTTTHNFWSDSVESRNAKIFRGGLTQFNPQLQQVANATDCGDCGKWDVSSAYPYQMTKPLPFGKLIGEDDFIEHYLDHLNEDEYYEFLVIPIDKAIPYENATYCATLPNLTEYRDENKQRFRYSNRTQERFTLALLKQEWDELQHWYDFKVSEVYEIKRYYMLAAPFLKDIALEMYHEKDRYSNEQKAAQKQGVKIAINSVYGSMGIKSEFDSLIYMENNTAIELEKTRPKELSYERGGNKATSCEIKHISEHLNTNYTAIHIKEHKEIKQCWNVAAASVITALERVYLMQTIRYIGAQHFGYTDTDSIVFVNLTPSARKKMETLEKVQPIQNTNIGRWECEYRYIKGFIPHKAKEYVQEIYKWDDKNKTFLDNKNNPCDKANAATFCKHTGAGFSLNQNEENSDIVDLFYMSLEQRRQLNDEEIKMIYKTKNLDAKTIEMIKQGKTLIIKGNKITQSYPSGDVIIWEDKWTKYGTI